MTVRKGLYLSDEDMILLEEYMKNNGIKTYSGAFSKLLHDENEKKALAVAVREELEANYLQKERIRWATQTAEQNSIVVLDLLNTLMHVFKIETAIPVEVAAHPAVVQSQERIKERIAYFKQKSDDRKRKEKS